MLLPALWIDLWRCLAKPREMLSARVCWAHLVGVCLGAVVSVLSVGSGLIALLALGRRAVGAARDWV